MKSIVFSRSETQCLSMENSSKKVVNYYQKSMIEIDKISRENKDFSIVIHSCCGPCSTHPIEFLSQYFKNIVIIYNNSNIYPENEYTRRLEELKRFIEIFTKENSVKINLVEFEYNNEKYNEMLKEFGPQKEGLDRCKFCYRHRMNEAYDYANKIGADYFTTVMTISRQKDSQILNQIGIDLSKNYTTRYFVSDFKKKRGIDRKAELIDKYKMYNQLYCGCIYSYSEFLKKADKK